VLRIGYADRAGATTVREIEPLGYVGSPAAHWYLMAWCRLRDGLRAFRTDRITGVTVTAEVAPPRQLRECGHVRPSRMVPGPSRHHPL
jgi:predicted DNA-binding transcriptional regulator YafY